MSTPRRPAGSAAISLTVCAALMALAAPTDARADCFMNATGFVCEGSDLNGINDSRPSILGQVLEGAVVEGNPAIEVGERVTVSIADGALISSNLTSGIVGGDALTVLNDGAIEVIRGGVLAGDDLRLVNGATGSVSADSGVGGAVGAGDDALVVNQGLLSGLIDIVVVGDRATVVNTGELFGQEDFVTAGDDLSVVNTGLMRGFNQGVVAGDRLDLTNTGTMRASVPVEADDDAAVANAGLIEGSILGVFLHDRGQVSVTPTGVIRGDEIAVAGRRGLVVENDGAIAADFDAVVSVADLQVANNGMIEASRDAVATTGGGVLAPVDDPGSLSLGNFGIIRGGVTGIRAGDGGSVGVENFGAIVGGEVGIVGGDGSRVSYLPGVSGLPEFPGVFDSLITASGDAVRLGRDAVVINEGLILSTGEGDAVSVIDGRIDTISSASIVSTGRAGVRARAPAPAGSTAGPLRIFVQGDIEGRVGIQADPGNTASQIVRTDAGPRVIRGTSGLAIDLGAGDDAVTISDDLIDGDVRLGAGDDTLALVSGADIDGDTLFGLGDDTLTYRRSMFGAVMDDFGLFAGGAGFDRATIKGFGLSDLETSPRVGRLSIPVRGRSIAAGCHADGLRVGAAR